MRKFDDIMFETHENIKKIMQMTINDCSSPDDEFLTSKSIDDVVLIVSQMPWAEDSEEEIICGKCHKHFEIRPKYKFLGFFVYTDDEQSEGQ